ncbi:MAG: hypothetical protein Q9192_005495, partial [Flavoplaca navasiana]
DALPSLAYIDLEKIKRETSFYSSRHPTSAASHMPAPPLISPSSLYSGPPPPYSYPSSTASSVVGGHTNGYVSSPTESRHILNEDKKEQQQLNKQSLPSIHEALNRDQPLSITSLLTSTTAAPLPSPQSAHYISNHSPTSPQYRSYKDYPPAGPPPTLPRTHSSPTHHSEQPRIFHSPRPGADPSSNRHSNGIIRESHYPPMLPPRTIPSPAPVSRPPIPASTFRPSSPQYDAVPRTNSTMNASHAYASYSAPYSYGTSMPSMTSNHQPPSPSNISNWRYGESDANRCEEYRRVAVKENMEKRSFGEAVKRHLDNFDLETSLNEIAEGSGRALEFSQHYGARAHQTQRSGPVSGSMPSVAECDELMSYQQRVLDSMQSIKEVIIAQQQALAEQRTYEHTYKPASEADEDGANFHEKLEGAGGFAGADAKKRRGRAAPPGRCHSCNRAETPEWRRGPDGARTLCNACGL